MNFAGASLDIAAIHADEAQNRSRFIFRTPLDDAIFNPLLSRLAAGSGRLFKPSAAAPQEALIFCNDRELPIRILDITRGGMSFSCNGAPVPDIRNFTIGNTAIMLREIVHDEACKMVSVSFSDPLDNEHYRWVRERFSMAEGT